MDQLWYYEDHGRAKGPVTTRDLINRIQKGEMTLMDLVFKEGQHQWMPAESFSEITELIGNITLNDAADWIVLKTVNVDGKNIHEQIGPFNAQQILDLIDKGKIRFSDYVWRTGYQKWVPLGRVDQFEKPLKSSVEVDKSLYTKPRHYDLLQDDKNVREAPLKKITQTVVKEIPASTHEPKPPEARGEDLAARSKGVEAKVVQQTEIVNTPSPKKSEAPPKKNKPQKRPEPKLEPKVEAKPLEVVPASSKPEPLEKTEPRAELLLAQELERERAEQLANLAPIEKPAPPPPVEKIALEQRKPHRAEPPRAPQSNLRVETKVVESRPAVEKIQSGQAQDTDLELSDKEAIPSPSDNVQKEVVKRKWIQAGIAACVVAIVFAAGLLLFMGKKKLDSKPRDEFSIKVAPPPNDITPPTTPPPAVAVAPRPAPVVETQGPSEKPAGANLKQPGVDKKTSVNKSAETKSTVAEKSKAEDTAPTIGGSFKNRSYYHHKERIYLFYTSSEGETLAADLQKATKSHQKSSKKWKSFYSSWKGKAKTYSSKVQKDAKKARLHRALYRQLAQSASQLEDLGRDFNSQISEGRAPSKVASAKSLESQFKTVNTSARNLDR